MPARCEGNPLAGFSLVPRIADVLVWSKPVQRRAGATGQGRGCAMANLGSNAGPTYGLFRRLWLTRFSQPARERPLYRHVLKTPPTRMIELGVGTLGRTERLLSLLRSVSPAVERSYVGLDRFEGRLPVDPPGVTLKQAHQRLHGLAKVQLVPGNIDTSLSKLCNHLGAFDLVLIAADNDPRYLERCWFFIQRITTPRTAIFAESQSGSGGVWASIPKARVDELAAKTVLKRAA